MPQFQYVARSSSGARVEGAVEATDRAGAMRLIEQDRAVPISIRQIEEKAAARTAKAHGTPTPKAKPGAAVSEGPVQTISHTQRFLWTEQLAHLLSAGMTLDEALGVLVKRLKAPRLQRLSTALHQQLIDGRSLSQAMGDYPKIFSPLYANMVAAGEASGSLSQILDRLTKHLSDVKGLRDRVQLALVYPAVLVVAGTGLITIFMVVMVPKLSDFLNSTGAKLPAATQLLIAANQAFIHYWWLAALIIGGIYAVLKAWTSTADGRRTWQRLVWNSPVYGLITRYRFYAEFSRTLGTLVENGVTMLRGLALLEDISGNVWVRERMAEVRKAVIDGANLSTAVAREKIFPELFIDMLAVGEQTGKFGDTMQMIANVYERELDKQVKFVSSVIPTVIIILIATLVGFVVYSILTAVFSLTSSFRTHHG